MIVWGEERGRGGGEWSYGCLPPRSWLGQLGGYWHTGLALACSGDRRSRFVGKGWKSFSFELAELSP